VASEVKQLATQTARSTQEISRQIGEVRSATLAVVSAVSRIETTIREVETVSGAITSAIEQQNGATAEIARGVSQTAEAVGEIRGRNAKVSTEAERSGAYARRVLENVKGVGLAVQDLNAAIVRAVRESTEDVNRRTSRRVDVDLAAWVDQAGQSPAACRVSNLSAGGARLSSTSSPVNESGSRIRIDGLKQPLGFTVISRNKASLGISFACDPAAATVISAFWESVDAKAAA
jgi:hypothetical protein